ncbi:MAG: NusG domain II-containing protein [Gammaproteobacteria bacterium]|nr:NusG domain II-containing protein [Gammaproteobacteria bacterium]
MTRADTAILIIAICTLPFVYRYYWQAETSADRVRIFSADQLIKELDLNKDRTVRVKGVLGHSHIQIKDGQVRFTDSPCTGKFCIHKGWLSEGGDFNACLPNQISIEVTGQQQFDSMNF